MKQAYENKQWANAILVNEASRSNYLNTTNIPVTIPEMGEVYELNENLQMIEKVNNKEKVYDIIPTNKYSKNDFNYSE